eukprot:TRINITY_DN1238_c0_g6_i1.p1 TRINITY_DN1238_c0_g6~~TRINITY_DN1238_c0_g6_i1.p1  ORF type:complete len:636 (+),score=86.12 TRINITY_DN1238_c0_g6_i1:93-2000(+)
MKSALKCFSRLVNVKGSVLSGATDVVGCLKKNAVIQSTPFNVRFGKLKLFSKRTNRRVKLFVNGKFVENVHMSLRNDGLVCFSDEINNRANMHFSPILSRSLSPMRARQKKNRSVSFNSIVPAEDPCENFLDSDTASVCSSSNESMDFIRIPRKSTRTFDYFLLKDEVINWNFKSQYYDIGFTVVFRPLEGEPTVIKTMERYNSSLGSYVASEAGSVEITFDNSFSKFRSKRFYLEVNCSAPCNKLGKIVLTEFGQGKVVGARLNLNKEIVYKVQMDSAMAYIHARELLAFPQIEDPNIQSELCQDDESSQNCAADKFTAVSVDPLESEQDFSSPVFEPSPSDLFGNAASLDMLDDYDFYDNDDCDETNCIPRLLPTQEELNGMDLKEGANSLVFEVESGLGAKRVEASFFLIEDGTKVVVSDVDGTITRSDAIGHISYFLNFDHTHESIAELFSKITNNGYQFIYITSRCIGQASATRNLITGIEQSGGKHLPAGPIITSPDRLFKAFKREIIDRKPQEFKIDLLTKIGELFTENPFYAGFGNRETDKVSYEAVGCQRKFIIGPDGCFQDRLSTILENYSSLVEFVDDIFPLYDPSLGNKDRSRECKAAQIDPNFISQNYWSPNYKAIHISDSE